jgi:hypothetical protein
VLGATSQRCYCTVTFTAADGIPFATTYKWLAPSSTSAISYRRFWEESFDKLDVVVNQMKKEEVRDDKKHG